MTTAKFRALIAVGAVLALAPLFASCAPLTSGVTERIDDATGTTFAQRCALEYLPRYEAYLPLIDDNYLGDRDEFVASLSTAERILFIEAETMKARCDMAMKAAEQALEGAG